MSLLAENILLQRANLFESTVMYSYVRCTGSVLVVDKCSDDSPLSIGEYHIDDLLDSKTLSKVSEHNNAIGSELSNLFFDIRYSGVKYHVACSSISIQKQQVSLWVFYPEKDNSIFYLQNAAHDFRSPLGSIMGVVNLMQHTIQSGEKFDKEEVSTLLDMIKVNTDKALNLAEEVMELAEMESKSYQLEKNEVVLSEFVQHYLDTHRLLTLKKRIQVKFDSQCAAVILINESKMTRALDNVLSNAVKFSEVGSTISFQLIEEDDCVVIQVSDQGIGMSADILRNLFTRFGNAKRSGLQGEPSHGLGMSIVQQIMKLHQGDIKVESEVGVGTKVSLILKKGK